MTGSAATPARARAETHATFFSVGLKTNKGLADLLDASAFKANQVIVYKDAAPLRQSVVRAWWSNPVSPLVANNATNDFVSVLSTPSAIYTVSEPVTTQGYNLNADRVAIVGLAGVQTLTFGGTPTFNCSATGEISTPNTRCVMSAGSQKHLWLEDLIIEGESGAYHGQVGVNLQNVHYSRLTRITTKNMIGTTAYGFWMQSNSGLRLKQLTVQNTSTYGVYWQSAQASTLDTLTVSGTA